MTDIVERMNKWRDERGFPTQEELLDILIYFLQNEAATEIERLKAELAAAIKARDDANAATVKLMGPFSS